MDPRLSLVVLTTTVFFFVFFLFAVVGFFVVVFFLFVFFFCFLFFFCRCCCFLLLFFWSKHSSLTKINDNPFKDIRDCFRKYLKKKKNKSKTAIFPDCYVLLPIISSNEYS